MLFKWKKICFRDRLLLVPSRMSWCYPLQDLPRGTLPFASSLHRAGIEGVSVLSLHAAGLLMCCRPQLQCIIRVILLLQCSAALLACQLEILTMLLAAGNILGPVAGVGLLVVQQPTNAELLGCCAWRETSVKMWNIKMPPWTRLALLTSGDSHRSSRSSSACRKSRGQRCRRASRSAQCSVADLGGLGVRVQASRMGRNVATRHWQQGQGKCAGGAPGPCPARRAATSDLRPVATAAHRHFTH